MEHTIADYYIMNPQFPIKTKNQRRAAAQAQRPADPVTRSLEQSANTVRRAVAREDPEVQACESAQQAVAREDHVTRSLEQSANTAQQAVARENLAVHHHESVQRAVAQEDPVVQAHESAQQTVAREDPAVREADPGDAAPDADATSQGSLAPLLSPIVHSRRKKWFCS